MLRCYNFIRLFFTVGILVFFQNASAQFTERTDDVHVYNKYTATVYIGGGAALIDVNNDLKLDLYLTGGLYPDRLYINNGEDFSRKIVFVGPEDFDLLNYEVIGVAAGDVNNDGYDDLFLSTAEAQPSLLMINNGDETFDILTPEESGIDTEHWGVSSAFGDVNKDGYIDLFTTNYVDSIIIEHDTINHVTIFNHTGFKNYLYINRGDNSFVEMGDAYGVQKESTTLSATFTDYDSDRDMDLYVINDFGHFIIPNELYQNQYPSPQFEDRSAVSGADIGIFGMGVAVGDHDNDLDLDYYITNIGRNVLISNNGDGTFDDVTNHAGVQDSVDQTGGRLVGWGTGFFDYDNDGWLDLYVSNGHILAAEDIANPQYNPSSLYRNNGDGTFEDVGRDMGIHDPAPFRGSVHGDLDNDGDLDLIFVPVSTEPNFVPAELNPIVQLYYNETENDNNWVKIKLIGMESNKNGYGAHVYAYDNSGHVQLRECDGGSSHASSNSPFIHFGLGSADGLDSLVVKWPMGSVQTIRNSPINTLIVIREGDDQIAASVTDQFQEHFDLYPNPATSYLSIQAEHLKGRFGSLRYEIHDVQGNMVLNGALNLEHSTLSIERLPGGTYTLSLSGEGHILGRRSFIKQ